MITKDLSKETIDNIFENCTESMDAVLKIYAHVVDNFHAVISMNHFPIASEATNEYIMGKCIEYDKAHNSKYLFGGAWFNNGFSIDNLLQDWTAVYDEDVISYGTELELQNLQED